MTLILVVSVSVGHVLVGDRGLPYSSPAFGLSMCLCLRSCDVLILARWHCSAGRAILGIWCCSRALRPVIVGRHVLASERIMAALKVGRRLEDESSQG